MKITFDTRTPKFIHALASTGYRALIAQQSTPPPKPPTQWSEKEDDEIDVLDDPGYLFACRDYDRQIVLAMRDSLLPKRDGEALSVCGLQLNWGYRMLRLKTWGGQQKLAEMFSARIDCMMEWAGKMKKKPGRKKKEEEAGGEEPVKKLPPPWQSMPAIEYQSALPGVSGLMPGHARINSLDLGANPNGVPIALHPWLEMLVIIGVEFSPVCIIPSPEHDAGLFAVYADGLWYPFYRRIRVDPYYFAWDVEEDRGLLPHHFAKRIDPQFSPGPFDDLQIPAHLLRNRDLLENQIERLSRILHRQEVRA